VIYVGSAGWNIPRAHKDRFPAEGSQLARYAARLNAAEINTSFYRPHAVSTYERWAAAVPPGFRFSVKIPKVISHERGLTRSREPLARFLDEIAGLGPRLGALLLQLPPKQAFDARRAGRFFELLRSRYSGVVVCEPRHATWTGTAASRMLEKFRIARVAADPPRAEGLQRPGGWTGAVYYRWHGSPRPYFSPYSHDQLRALAADLAARGAPSSQREVQPEDAWCIFDNTGSGSAAANALDLCALLPPSPPKTSLCV
jgi:uncharacterized protein YecE (DUF72 family)